MSLGDELDKHIGAGKLRSEFSGVPAAIHKEPQSWVHNFGVGKFSGREKPRKATFRRFLVKVPSLTVANQK